jgi:hypothetical protein
MALRLQLCGSLSSTSVCSECTKHDARESIECVNNQFVIHSRYTALDWLNQTPAWNLPNHANHWTPESQYWTATRRLTRIYIYSRSPIWALLTSSGRRIWILDSTSSTQGGCDQLCDFSNMRILEVLLQNIVNYFRLCFCRVRSSSNSKIAVCNSVHNSVHKHTVIVSE